MTGQLLLIQLTIFIFDKNIHQRVQCVSRRNEWFSYGCWKVENRNRCLFLTILITLRWQQMALLLKLTRANYMNSIIIKSWLILLLSSRLCLLLTRIIFDILFRNSSQWWSLLRTVWATTFLRYVLAAQILILDRSYLYCHKIIIIMVARLITREPVIVDIGNGIAVKSKPIALWLIH